MAKSAAATSTLAPVMFAVCVCVCVCVHLVTLVDDWLDAVYVHLGLYVNQLAYIIYMFQNHQTDPKPAQILSTRPSQYWPAQSNSKPAQSGNTAHRYPIRRKWPDRSRCVCVCVCVCVCKQRTVLIGCFVFHIRPYFYVWCQHTNCLLCHIWVGQCLIEQHC